MITRRDLLATAAHALTLAGAATLLAPAGALAAAATPTAGPLRWQAFPAGEGGFFRSPVLLSGDSEAILIDGGFTLSDGRALADAIKATGKRLTAIYVSQSDPDYYFGLGPVKAAFPDARVIAAPATVEAIKGNVEKKLAVWGPKLKENGPQTLAEVVMPQPFDGASLTLDGQTVEIVDAQGLPNRRYLWVPSLQAVFGGVLVFSGLHVWTADTPTAEARAAWVKALDAMAARKPAVVVAGHAAPGAAPDAAAIAHTRGYLLAFEEELAKAKTSAELIAAMTRRYPDAGMGIALDIGAKVATGEMRWG
ncbi:MBL fold metallo-hydrolase [Azospirillum melinis]|uniref:MBL fold metallo-hydrolase n=1 Tax=Azospirillum melinis TaxID=328839 RepID=A0ABX2K889_9PROT|nr:MBL fold metallo-hydrolase [Azospirillum melinis]MBP2306801.1 glyoxylase-like metal-dependent hydrolase (beta-lactamase superfamily II) [Azospirillum melinis]NUA98691.1 MBL fold metallo-hydrolase [Azospirillum melinis]